MLAILLLGTGFAVLLQVLNAGLATGGFNESEIVATYLCQEKIESLRNTQYSGITDEAKAVVPGFTAFKRQVAVSIPQTDLKEISVTAYWNAGPTETSITMVTYVSNS